MNISEHFQKEFWARRLAPGTTNIPMPVNDQYYIQPLPSVNGECFRYMTTSDFLNEIDPGAHETNSPHWIMRPVYNYVNETDKNGKVIRDKDGKPKKRKEFLGYQQMETTRCTLQRRFAIAKANHSAQKGFWIGNESPQYKKEFQTLLSWRDVLGLRTAYFETVLSLRQCCEAACYLFAEGGTLQYKVFSPLYGDTLFPDYDDNHNPILYRLYTLRGKKAVDIYACDYVETWVQCSGEENKGKDLKWWQRISGWFSKETKWEATEVSEDGWRRLGKRRSTQIGNNLNQVVYFRVPDLATGCVEDEIKSWERAMSYVAESMKVSAFPDKLVKATKIKSLPSPDAFGRTYAVEGDVDQLKASDMKTIDPGDMSNIATVNINTKMDMILHGSMSVIISPEILKAGADSSSALKLMFTSEIQDAEAFWVLVAPQVRYLIEVFKALVAKVEMDDVYTKIRTSIEPITWIPQNTSELIDNTTKLVYAGVLAKENAASEVDLQYPGGLKSVEKEQAEELYRKTYIPLKAKYDAERQFGVTDVANDVIVTEEKQSNPVDEENKPKIDNNADRKDIADNVLKGGAE